jgi:hypothetical protein
MGAAGGRCILGGDGATGSFEDKMASTGWGVGVFAVNQSASFATIVQKGTGIVEVMTK